MKIVSENRFSEKTYFYTIASRVAKDLICLASFEGCSVYLGVGWRKKFKSPTDFGFALKPPQVSEKLRILTGNVAYSKHMSNKCSIEPHCT